MVNKLFFVGVLISFLAAACAAPIPTITQQPTAKATNTLVEPTETSSPPPEYAEIGDTVYRIVFTSSRNGVAQIFEMQSDGSGQVAITDTALGSTHALYSPDGTVLSMFSFELDQSDAGIRWLLGNMDMGIFLHAREITWSPDSERMVLTYQAENGHLDLALMSQDSLVTPLIEDPADDQFADWCGDKILFTSFRLGAPRLFVINDEGSDLQQIDTGEQNAYLADWSPDCSQIAFTTKDDSGNTQIIVMNADGSDRVQLTNSPGYNEDPAWSPDGKLITFWSDRSGNSEIYVMNSDGSNQVNISNNPAVDESPSWVPEG